MENVNLEVTKDYLDEKHNRNIIERKLHDENQRLRQEYDQIREKLDVTMLRTQLTTKVIAISNSLDNRGPK